MTLSPQFGRRGRDAGEDRVSWPEGLAPEFGGGDPLSAFDRPFPFRITAAMASLAIPVTCLLGLDRTAIAAPLGLSFSLAMIAGLPLAAAYTPILGAFAGKPLRDANWATRLTVIGLAILIATFMMLEINVRFDRSAPASQAFPVLAKRISAGDGGGDFRVDVEMASPPGWPRELLGKDSSREYVWVFYSDYLRTVVGSSVIVLEIHPGALGLPWYRRHQYVLR
jgi:hypothetical protein